MDKALILKGIADNPALMEELKKLFLEEFEMGDVNISDSNELLGQLVKARLMGVRAVEAVFDKILEYKTPGEKVEGKHPGR